MNKKQEQALFGNVLPEEIRMDRDIIDMGGILKIMMPDEWDECKRILSLAHSQREAIGALIESQIDIENLTEYVNMKLFECMPDKLIIPIAKRMSEKIEIILSAVIQDTLEDVRKAWEENQ